MIKSPNSSRKLKKKKKKKRTPQREEIIPHGSGKCMETCGLLEAKSSMMHRRAKEKEKRKLFMEY